MPNDFEKQVKQKMEELTFVPQAPVWNNIEKQIRQKKRKRMIVWLPVMLILVGSSIVLLSRHSIANHLEGRTDVQGNDYQHQLAVKQNKSAAAAPENSSKKTGQSSVANANSPSRTTNTSEGVNDQTTAQSKVKAEAETAGGKAQKQTQNLSVVSHQYISNDHSETAQLRGAEGNKIIDKQNPAADHFYRKLITANQSLEKQFSATKIENDQMIHGFQGLNSTYPTQITGRANIAGNQTTNIIADKGIDRKWRMGVWVSGGISSMNSGLGITEKSLDFNYAAGPSSAGNNPGSFIAPSDVKNGLSFAIGFVLKKQLGKRSFFSTGLQYNYYSTKITVGSNIRMDTLLSTNRAIRDFYLNSAFVTSNPAYVTTTSEYINQYHFISLPAALDYRLLRKAPLDIHIGFSYQRLVATNALQYDYAKSIYYKDNSAFNKNQLFSELGINYSFLKNRSLIVGPQYQYSFTSLDGNSNNHLAAFSLKASYLF